MFVFLLEVFVMSSKEIEDYNWIPEWIPNRKEVFGYPDSLIESRTAKAYEFALQNIDITEKVVLDYGSGYGHGVLRIGLQKPKLLVSTAQYLGVLSKQRELFQSQIDNLKFVQVKNNLPFTNNQFDVVFLNHVIEHINPQLASPFIDRLSEIIKPSGVVCVATPNAKEVIKPLTDGNDYVWEALDALLCGGFAQREPYSLIPNKHALSIHRRKQFVAKIPGTGKIRDIVSSNLWEFVYGSGLQKVRPSDFHFIEGYNEDAIDFLVLCRK